MRNGTCLGINGNLQCNCAPCYSGPICNITDYCCLNVCSPNGLCRYTGINTYTCICQPPYIGANCTTLNPCAVLPCLNNGRFETTKTKYI